MKSILITVVLCMAGLVAVNMAVAQERGNEEPRVSPNAAVSQTIGTTVVEVTYGRPSVNDRLIFGGLVPWDEVWRTGANESTVVVFSDDVTVEGEPVEAGTYSLYTLPMENNTWTIILNHKLSWGTQYDEAEDYIRVDVEAEEAPYVEQMIIYFENVGENSGNMVIHWDDTKVPVRIDTQTN